MKLFDSIPTECIRRPDYEATGVKHEVWLKPSVLRKAARLLHEDGWHIEEVTALDTEEGILLVYHFDKMTRPARLTIKVMADSGAVPTIADIFQGANWHERETRDFHAVDFTGHPNLWPLLLPADMEPGVLLKDGAKKPIRELLSLDGAENCSAAIQALFAEPEAEEAEAKE